MELNSYKPKKFLLPILSLVLISIISIASMVSYVTVSKFKNHMEDQIIQLSKQYTDKHKDDIYKEVNFVNNSIKFQITKIENKLKDSLKENILIALDVANFTYNIYKDKLNKKELKKKISEALSVIKFNDDRGYFFMYDNKTKVIFGHPLEKFIGKDMTNFRDSRGQSLMQLDEAALAKEKIGYSKIYFNKPDNQKEEFPKITCITKFEPLDLVIGIGEYLDVIEDQIKKEILERFASSKDKDKYLFILDVHNIEGGDEFATVLLNSNEADLIGSKISDKQEDIKGNMFIKQFLNLVQEKGEGFLQYWNKKPSTQISSLKVSYIFFQKDWNWIIGSGFYYDDLEKMLLSMIESIDSHTDETINKTIVLVFLLSLFSIFVAVLVSFKIDKTIEKYTNTIIDYQNKKAEQELVLMQQSKLASMGEMLGNIAHQWRQPLSIISTLATGIKVKSELELLHKNELVDTMTNINESTQYLSQTIDDFRTFFEPHDNKIKEFNIIDMMEKTLKLLKSQFKSKNIEIIKNIENNSLKSLENEMIQVLINILNNAIDALELKNQEIKLILINSYKKNKSVYIEILDNAGGVDDNIKDRIFEPYFTTKHQFKGTGIGLYMSQYIVNNHLNGSLNICTEDYLYKDIKYKGAKFIITIT